MPHCRPHLDLDYFANKQKEDIEPEFPRGQKKSYRRANLLMNANAGVDQDANADAKFDDKNDNLDEFNVAIYRFII